MGRDVKNSSIGSRERQRSNVFRECNKVADVQAIVSLGTN